MAKNGPKMAKNDQKRARFKKHFVQANTNFETPVSGRNLNLNFKRAKKGVIFLQYWPKMDVFKKTRKKGKFPDLHRTLGKFPIIFCDESPAEDLLWKISHRVAPATKNTDASGGEVSVKP